MIFNTKYFIITLILFFTEVFIATVLQHRFFIRAFVGDILVVILIYTFILTFFNIKNKKWLIVGIFLFATLVEVLQYFKIADRIGFLPNSIPYIVIGNTFSMEDIICYAIGCFILLILSHQNKVGKRNTSMN